MLIFSDAVRAGTRLANSRIMFIAHMYSSCLLRKALLGFLPILAVGLVGSACSTSTTTPELTQTPVADSANSRQSDPISQAPTSTHSPDTDRNQDHSLPAPDIAVVVSPFLTTAEIVKRLRPSVVRVQTELIRRDLFGRPIPDTGVGTGEILDKQGHILTNSHVVEGAERILVTLRDNRTTEATLVGKDPSTDLAVLRITAENLAPITMGRSSELEVGEPVIAIGHALDLRGAPTVTGGLISALGRSIDLTQNTTVRNLIQTDAAINPGNSGGPLVNMRGEMIGVNTAKIQAGEGIGFAIAIDPALRVVRELIAKGSIERGFVGISVANVTEGLVVTEGVIVVQVQSGSPAKQAGLQTGDIIVELGGKPIRNVSDLEAILMDYGAGKTVNIHYFRDSSRKKVDITLSRRPSD